MQSYRFMNCTVPRVLRLAPRLSSRNLLCRRLMDRVGRSARGGLRQSSHPHRGRPITSTTRRVEPVTAEGTQTTRRVAPASVIYCPDLTDQSDRQKPHCIIEGGFGIRTTLIVRLYHTVDAGNVANPSVYGLMKNLVH